MNKILAFDTTDRIASVAISDGSKLLAYTEEKRSSMQAETLLPMISSVLALTKLTYNDLSHLVVTNGPGSFTGIRIGLAAAQGIILGASHILATSVTNFEIIAARAFDYIKHCEQLIVILDAYRGQLYVQHFDQEHKTTSAPYLINYAGMISLLKESKEQRTVCVGSGIKYIAQEISSLKQVTILLRPARIKAAYLCYYIAKLIHSRPLQPLEPLYIRAADVNISKNKMKPC